MRRNSTDPPLGVQVEIIVDAVQGISVEDGTLIVLRWRRGSAARNSGQSAPTAVNRGMARLSLQQFTVSARLHRGKDGFKKKPLLFTVKRLSADGVVASSVLGRAAVDVAALCRDGGGSAVALTLPADGSHMDASAAVLVRATASWVHFRSHALMRRVGTAAEVDRRAIVLDPGTELVEVYDALYVARPSDFLNDDSDSRSTDSSALSMDFEGGSRSHAASESPADLHATLRDLESLSFQRLKRIGELEKTVRDLRERSEAESGRWERTDAELRDKVEQLERALSEQRTAAQAKSVQVSSLQQKNVELRELLEEKDNTDEQLLLLRNKQETILTLETELASERSRIAALLHQVEELQRARPAPASAPANSAVLVSTSSFPRVEDRKLTSLEGLLPPEAFARFSLLAIVGLVMYLLFF